ncbi:MAG TPA: glycogen synthase GlgA [Pelomicrobium sp.]|nr:glycogen synthase GlgA [Pelomicrobium sp.]
MPTPAPLRVLFVTSEIHPLIKTGGLGDVSGALPRALMALGVDVRVMVPGYPAVMDKIGATQPLADLPAAGGYPEASLLAARADDAAPLVVVDCPLLYDRDGGPYQSRAGEDWPDNALRFGLLGRAGALLGCAASPLDWRPDVVHCHDWQAALAPAYLRFAADRRAATVMTIHNLAFQGLFPADSAAALALPEAALGVDGLEYWGKLSFLKGGVVYADHITTVSPTYAREIQEEPLGFGFQGLLKPRADRLSGILNGIDEAVWNPAGDRLIPRGYDADTLELKVENKRVLQAAVGLPTDDGAPLLGMVSRLTEQKGVDLVAELAPRIAQRGAQLVVLGSGDAGLEKRLAGLAQELPRSVAVRIRFDETLSHLIEAGADAFLMPSRFEPCGLNQMYSQRYGTPPIVHATGGLCDSVEDATPAAVAAGRGTGFVFRSMTEASFLHAIDRALAAYRTPATWTAIQRAGMARDFSWKASAEKYRDLYRSLVQRNG